VSERGVTSTPAAFADMGKRLIARLLDGALYLMFVLLVALALRAGAGVWVEVDPVTGEVSRAHGLRPAYLVAGLLTLIVVVAYEVVMIAARGATLGKIAMQIRVVREADGQTPGVGASLLRWLVPFAGSLVCGVGQLVVYLSPYFDNSKRFQGWHDKAARTFVVQG
jgi:uncharacterized RDD family membrane protein YckC